MLGCSASSCCLLRRSRCRKRLAHMAVAARSSPVSMRTGGATVPACIEVGTENWMQVRTSWTEPSQERPAAEEARRLQGRTGRTCTRLYMQSTVIPSTRRSLHRIHPPGAFSSNPHAPAGPPCFPPDCLAGTAAQAALALSSKRPAAATQVGTPQVRTCTGARCARQLQPQLCNVIWQLAPLLQQLRRTSGPWQQRAQLLLHGCGASVVVWVYEGWCCAGDNSGQKSVSRLQQVLSQCCMLCLLCLLTALSRATAAVLGHSLLVAAGAAHGRQMFSCRARAVGHVADDRPTQLQALVPLRHECQWAAWRVQFAGQARAVCMG